MGELLAIYLNDHLAGATVGVELARRLRGSNEGDPEFGSALTEICAEIEADRETLKEVMDRLGVDQSKLKPLAATLGERLGRLKPNGQLRGYSPLSNYPRTPSGRLSRSNRRHQSSTQASCTRPS